MPYKISCDSPLLQKTLEYYLKDMLSGDGIIITDNPEKEGILIGKDIKKPFTKTSLIMQLEKKFQKEPGIEEKIEKAFENFKQEIIEIIKSHIKQG